MLHTIQLSWLVGCVPVLLVGGGGAYCWYLLKICLVTLKVFIIVVAVVVVAERA